MSKKNKEPGKVKEWLSENWPLLVYGGICGGLIGLSCYGTYKANKEAKRLEEYWQTPEAWEKAAKEYQLQARICDDMKDHYAAINGITSGISLDMTKGGEQ